MRNFCLLAIHQLTHCKGDFGKLYVDLRMKFHREHGHKLITSTHLGSDFFSTLVRCIDGEDWSVKEFKGEYEDNFRKLILIGRAEA